MNKKVFFCACVFLCALGTSPSVLKAGYVCPLEIFTNNGSYNDSSDIVLYVEVSDGGTGRVDFTFFNESLVNSAIAAIYFDDGLLLDIAAITNGLGTSFSQPATPHNLPAGNTLNPPFVTTENFSIDGDSPPPKNGVNPGEWVRITFTLKGDGEFGNVIDQLDSGIIRIGMHLIALPDGSSESAVNTPEPMTAALLMLSSLSLFYRRRK